MATISSRWSADTMILIILMLTMLRTSSARICYQCVSELALINWSRYGLPYLQRDSMMADDSCLDDARLPGHITCSAPCMTINVTAIGGRNDGKIIGIVRDCQTYFRSIKSLPVGTTHMCRHSEREIFRSHRINVTFCYCQENLCNGNRSSIHLSRPAQRISPALHDASSSASRVFPSLFASIVFTWLVNERESQMKVF